MMFGRPEWRLACLWALTSPCLVSAPPSLVRLGAHGLGSFPCVLRKGSLIPSMPLVASFLHVFGVPTFESGTLDLQVLTKGEVS